jgi:D-aminopeptidase
VLVQANFGGVLTIGGAPVGRALGRWYMKEELERPAKGGRQSEGPADASDTADGSVIVVIATDAPLDARNLRRLAARSMHGLARTGSAASNGSGDYAIAFATAADVRIHTSARPAERNAPRTVRVLPNDALSPLFLAVIEATEEAVYNALFQATTVTGQGRTVEALPLNRTLEILRKYGALGSHQKAP